jgi:hypothetical protein
MTSDDFDQLIARIAVFEGESQELDARVLHALLAPEGSKIEESPINGQWVIYEPTRFGREPYRLWQTPSPLRQMRSIITSVDAVLELCGKSCGNAEAARALINALHLGDVVNDQPIGPQIAKALMLDLLRNAQASLEANPQPGP